MKRRDLLPLLAAAPLLPGASARAQQAPGTCPSWSPDRPVRFVVGFAPGGSTDTTARVVAQGISAGLGQPVVVENRTGAAGNVATEHVARSAPDGHTLVVASMGARTPPTPRSTATCPSTWCATSRPSRRSRSARACSWCTPPCPCGASPTWSPAPRPSPAG